MWYVLRDQSGVSLLPSVRATWAPWGQTPVLRDCFVSQRSWLSVEQLRCYAPDLNPTEQVWGNLKSTELANLCSDTIVVPAVRRETLGAHRADQVVHFGRLRRSRARQSSWHLRE